MPKRIQRKRAAGWRMPDGAVNVTRPGKFGNPFTIDGCRDVGFRGDDTAIAARCVEAFRVWADTDHWQSNWSGEESERKRNKLRACLPALKGKDLACWCALDQPCHADVLLELANK